MLSIRRDLLPPEYIAALATLQDDAPLLDFSSIREVVEAGLGQRLEDVFAAFDELPLGTASIAQTHRAVALGGTSLVVSWR